MSILVAIITPSPPPAVPSIGWLASQAFALPPPRAKRVPPQVDLSFSFTGNDTQSYAFNTPAPDGPTFVKTVLYQSRAYVVPELTNRMQWGFELAQPVRRKARNPETSFILDPYPLINVVTAYEWMRQDGLEVPPQRPKRTPSQPWHFLDPFPLPFVEPPFSEYKFTELSQRIFRHGRRAAIDSQVPMDPSAFYPAFDHMAWWQAMSEPKRRNGPRVVDTLKSETHQPDPVVPFHWYEPLREPKRRRPQVPSGAEPQLSFTHLETVMVMRWFTEMNRPVLPKDRRFHQERLVIAPSQLVAFSWFMEANQPMRRHKVHPARQEWTMGAVIAGTLHPLIFTNWFAPLDLPKRNKRQWDHYKGIEPFAFGGFIEKFGIGWWRQLSEPVRPLPQIGAEQQPSENTTYIKANMPFARTGPLYLHGRQGTPGTSIWRGRTRT